MRSSSVFNENKKSFSYLTGSTTCKTYTGTFWAFWNLAYCFAYTFLIIFCISAEGNIDYKIVEIANTYNIRTSGNFLVRKFA